MRTIASGTVNSVAFSLKEDGTTECKSAKYCNLISEIAKASLDESQKIIKEGLHANAVLNIADDLEDCKKVRIRVKQTTEYLDNLTEIHYFHLPRNKSNAKQVFLEGKFKTKGKFTVLVNHATQVIDPEGKVHKAYANLLGIWIDRIAMRFNSPSIPDRNYAIYKALQEEVPAIQIEKACFYHYSERPNSSDILY